MNRTFLLCVRTLIVGLCFTSAGQGNPPRQDSGVRKPPGQFPKKPVVTIDPKTGDVQSRTSEGSIDKIASTVKETASSPATKDVDPLLPLPPPDWANDPATRQKYLESLQGYYDYRRVGYQHRQGDFKWQHYSTIIIFVAVLTLVFSGIYFAYVQFHTDLKLKELPTALGGEKSEVELSLKGMKVSSPVLGVVILVVSLGFFYLYLVYVYPISDAF